MEDTSSATLHNQHCRILLTLPVRWTLINSPPSRVAAEAAAAERERCETREGVPHPPWPLARLLVTRMCLTIKPPHHTVSATVLLFLACSPLDAIWAPDQGKPMTGVTGNMVIRT